MDDKEKLAIAIETLEHYAASGHYRARVALEKIKESAPPVSGQ